MIFKSLGSSVSAVAAFLLIAAAGFAQVPASKHVVLVIDENSSYDDVMDNMPWLTSQGSSNGYASNYLSDNGGSLLDYLWLASGSCHSSGNCKLPAGTHDFRCNGNDCYYKNTTTSDPITDDNIFRELNNAGISWKVYAQSYSLAGGTVTTPDNNNGTAYYRRHNGATWYSDILSNVNQSANNIVDLTKLTTDVADGKLPAFVIIVPDGNHDAHDCPVGMSSCTQEQKLSAADGFLSSTLEPILATPDFQPGGGGLAIVTFDECASGTNGGCGASVYTALIGPNVSPHFVSKVRYKHENTLRTMLEALGIKNYPGASSTAAAMSDFFITTGDKPQVDVTNPIDGATVGSSVSLEASVVPSSGHTTTGWAVYVDSVSVFTAGAKSSINPTLSMETGEHTVVVRAWDSSGAYGDQTLSLTVSAPKPR
jgi:Phosphoesterase family